jgi:hypothetical protein
MPSGTSFIHLIHIKCEMIMITTNYVQNKKPLLSYLNRKGFVIINFDPHFHSDSDGRFHGK